MDDSLVGRRSKRSTAGNRMEAALAEMNIDDLMQDVEEDVDFVSKVDEEDVFESDFASTDEDAQDDEDAGERALQDEEKRAKRAARSKPYNTLKTPARKVTFDEASQLQSQPPDGEGAKSKSKPQRRVSLGYAVDAETGEVLETSKRQSTREATRLNTRELQSRLKTAEGRRASITKRPKEIERRKTQAELITAALDMEEDNIKSHRDYLVIEEERRKKARVVKASTVGPKVRWRSRVEDVTVTVYDPVPYQVQRPSWTSPYAPAANASAQPQQPSAHSGSYGIAPGQPAASGSNTVQTQPHGQTPQYAYAYTAPNVRPPPTTTSSTTIPSTSTSATAPSTTTTTNTSTSQPPAPTPTTTQPFVNQYYPYSYYNPQAQPPHSQYQPYGPYYAYQPQQSQYPPGQNQRPHLQLHPQGPVPRKTTEKQAKNYAEVLIDQEHPQEKPSWRQTMDALFGKHVDWDNVRVYVGKNRPNGRQVQTCPITGLQARYRDPRTGVPYANAGAFRILSRLLVHEYVWSPAGAPGGIGVYVGHEKQRGAFGVPGSWGEAMSGVEGGPGWRKRRIEGRKEEKVKEKEKEKEKEVRVGERRSLRIAGDGGEMDEKEPMVEREKGPSGEVEDKMDVDTVVQAES